jgi:hypothetical protein
MHTTRELLEEAYFTQFIPRLHNENTPEVTGRLVWEPFEYLHRSSVGRRRRQKGNTVPGVITGPPCSWGI